MNKDLLLSLLDRVVRIDRGGPESRIGKVLAVQNDHITLLTEDDGVVYYVTQHIKSITDNARQGLQFNIEIPEDFKFAKAHSFVSVLENLRYHWVKINRGGPETLEGVINDANNEFVTIVSNEEIIRLSMSHIRNLSYGVKIEKTDSEESKSKENNNNSKKQKDSKENKHNSKEEKSSHESKDSSKEQENPQEVFSLT